MSENKNRGRVQSAVAVESEEMAAFQEREAKRQAAKSLQPEVKAEWFEMHPAKTSADLAKKGNRLLRMQLTSTGVTSSPVGHSKKIPGGYLKQLKDTDQLKPVGWKPESTKAAK